MLSAEIIAIGSELLTPDRTDTNSLWLTGKLNEIGIDVKLKTVVGDDEARLEDAIRDAMTRSDVVITTGGLGPTEDDITRQVSARAVGRELVYHDDIEAHLRERFKQWGRDMPETNKRQAYVIDDADVLPNPNGSAVGMMVEIEGRFLIILPGPPRENQPMFNDHVFGRLQAKAGDFFTRKRVLRVSGIGESALDEAIAPIYRSYKKVQTSILFNKTEVEVHLFATGESYADADRTIEELVGKISEKLGAAVFALNGETMEEIIGRQLSSRGETLATAESCTGGLIAKRLTEISGSSSYFMEGAVTYSNEAKVRTLSVPRETLDQYGAVSAETAEAMAKGMRERSGTTYAVSVTGVAGPTGGSEEKPVGTVFIGFADENKVKSIKFVLPGDRYLIRWRASQAALDYLRRQILKKI
jgi:nicotinamide-nucleotide amidase